MSRLNVLRSEKLPTSWNLLAIGKVLLDSQYGTNEPVTEGGNTKVVGMKDIQNGKIVMDNLTSSNLSEDEREKYLLHRGDLLINRTNSYDLVGKVGIFESDEEVAFASYLVRLVIDKSKISAEFLNYWLNGQIAQTAIKRIATRAISQANINPTEFKKHCFVPLPHLPEQTAISKLLSTWDHAIEKTERLIVAKEKRLRALYQLCFQPGTPMNVSWQKTKISKFVKTRNEKLVPTEDTPLFSLTIENGVTAKTDRYNRDFLVKDTNAKTYKVVYPGDIVFNPANLRWGAIARSVILQNVVISPIYEVLEIRKDAVDPEFLTHALTCPRQIGIFATKTEGTLIERMAVKLDAFLLTEILLPISRDEQQKIAALLCVAKKEIDLLKKQLEAYRKQKCGLMQKLLTGQWRVKVSEEIKNG